MIHRDAPGLVGEKRLNKKKSNSVFCKIKLLKKTKKVPVRPVGPQRRNSSNTGQKFSLSQSSHTGYLSLSEKLMRDVKELHWDVKFLHRAYTRVGVC